MLKKLFFTFLLVFSLIGRCFAEIELDFMEYATDALAQAAYVTDAAEAVNQQQILVDYGRWLGDDADNELRCGQEFQLQSNTTITAVEVKQYSVTGSPTGNWTLRIETSDGSDNPTGTLAHTNASIVVSPPGNGNAVKGTFASPFSLSANTKYHIVILCDNQATDVGWGISGQSSGTPYAYGGINRQVDGVWTAYYADQALYFKIYTKALLAFSEATIKQQGSYSLKVVAAITDSLNKTLTRTVSPTIDLTGQTQIKYWAYALRTGSNFKIGWRDSGLNVIEHTPNIIQSNTWEEQTVDISAVSDANKDAIDRKIFTVLNADATNTVYLDNVYGEVGRRRMIIFN